MTREQKPERKRPALPSVEKVQQALGKAESIDDFFGAKRL
jgi:hypothetical protein